MAISGISASLTSPATQPKADETLQQLADQGDPIAIAELKQQEEQQNPTTTPHATGPAEPGKGENVDTYI
jgi:hypothetical protein